MAATVTALVSKYARLTGGLGTKIAEYCLSRWGVRPLCAAGASCFRGSCAQALDSCVVSSCATLGLSGGLTAIVSPR